MDAQISLYSNDSQFFCLNDKQFSLANGAMCLSEWKIRVEPACFPTCTQSKHSHNKAQDGRDISPNSKLFQIKLRNLTWCNKHANLVSFNYICKFLQTSMHSYHKAELKCFWQLKELLEFPWSAKWNVVRLTSLLFFLTVLISLFWSSSLF